MESAFQGTSTLQPFAPRWTDPDLLEKILVGRRALVDKLEQLAIEGAGGPNKYQRLIIGPRGSGKTHVLKVLHTRLMRNQALRDRLLIVYLLEDELGIASFRDFLVRLLRAIQTWYPDQKEIASGLENLYDLPPTAQQRRAVELLLHAAGDRDLLIIMENLGVTFDQKQGFGRKGQQAFRDLVQQYPRFMLFASAQALLDGVSAPNAPFYEFFKITHLHKLTLDEAVELLTDVAKGYGKPEVVKLLGTAEGRGRVRAIYDFTGGNHRLLVTFYDFLTVDSVAKLSEAFVDALQPLKPYYQEQMRSLSAQQQKIVQYLSVARTPKTVKEIARGCLATSNTVSSQMKALLDRGFVERIPQGRESYYEITETLFRICYEADLDHQGAPIRLFVDFLGNFYSAQELDTRARGFLLLARTANAERPRHETEAALYQKALLQYHPDHQLKASPQEERMTFFRDLAEHAWYDEIISFAGRLGEAKDASIAVIEAGAYVERDRLGDACGVLRTAVGKEPENSDLQARLGTVLFRTGDVDGAETHCRKALELDAANTLALQTLVAVLDGKGQISEALQYQTALVNSSDAPDAASLTRLGDLHHKLGHVAEVDEASRRAVAADPNDAVARVLLATCLWQSGRRDDALEQAEAMVRLQPGENGPRNLAAVMLVALGRPSEAESHYRAALDLHVTDAVSLRGLGELLVNSGRAAEGFRYLDTAVSLNPDNPAAWIAMGKAHQTHGELGKAEASFRKAVQLHPGGDSISALAGVLIRGGRYTEAEPLLRSAVEREPDHTHARVKLVDLLMQTDRAAEALEQVLAAQRLPPHSSTLFILGGLVALKIRKPDEAERHLRRAVQLDATQTDAWVMLAQLLSAAGRYGEALDVLSAAVEKADKGGILKARADLESEADDLAAAATDYQAVLELRPDDPPARFAHSAVLLRQGLTSEAIDAMKKAIEASDDSVLAEGLRLNLMALFSFGTRPQMTTFLDPLLELLLQRSQLGAFERALSVAVFGFLKQHKNRSEERFADVSWALENHVARYINVSVALLFLTVGVDYLKRGDMKALMRLSREERALFTKELGIDATP